MQENGKVYRAKKVLILQRLPLIRLRTHRMQIQVMGLRLMAPGPSGCGRRSVKPMRSPAEILLRYRREPIPRLWLRRNDSDANVGGDWDITSVIAINGSGEFSRCPSGRTLAGQLHLSVCSMYGLEVHLRLSRVHCVGRPLQRHDAGRATRGAGIGNLVYSLLRTLQFATTRSHPAVVIRSVRGSIMPERQ